MARATTGQKSFIEQARREQIVDAAIDVLYENGFAAASLGAIAERIGVSKGVLSYHFAGKSELLREVIAHVLTEAGEYMRPRIAAASSSLDALRIYVTSNLEYIGAQRRKIIAFTEIVLGMPPGGTEPPPAVPARRASVARLESIRDTWMSEHGGELIARDPAAVHNSR
jgi:AcrR family transcriptional regulator